MEEERSEVSTSNRKKRKSFLQKAKKFGKNGRFGRGCEVDKETYDYFVRVLEQLNASFGDDADGRESQEIFVSNVFKQTVEQEASLCANQLVSRVLEKLLPLSGPEDRIRFMGALSNDLRLVAINAYASHVLETLLFLVSFEEKFQENGNYVDHCNSWVLRVSKFMINNFEDFAHDPYASHLIRTCLQCLAGTRVEDCVQRSRKSRAYNAEDRTASKSNLSRKRQLRLEGHEDVIKLMFDKVASHPDVKDMVSNNSSSAVVQTLLLVAKNSAAFKEESKKLCKVLLEKVYSDVNVVLEQESFEERCQPLCRTLEALMVSAPKKVFSKMLDTLFDGNMLKWARHPAGNFTVQKLLSCIEDEDRFQKWYEKELDDNMEDVVSSGNYGVVVSIAQACRRLKVKQAHFQVALMKSLHCFEPSQNQSKFAALSIHFSTLEVYEEARKSSEKIPISLHGTLILQELLEFQKPIKLVSSLLAVDKTQLCSLLCDPRGCHITDAFMGSTTIGEKSREALVKALNGQLASMASSKHGSRSVDAIWKRASPKMRESIAAELSDSGCNLRNDKFGKFLFQSLAIDTFKRSREEWRKVMASREKGTAVAKEFLQDLKSVNKVQVAKQRGFVIDTEAEAVQDDPAPPQKKKKKSKSYLDDL